MPLTWGESLRRDNATRRAEERVRARGAAAKAKRGRRLAKKGHHVGRPIRFTSPDAADPDRWRLPLSIRSPRHHLRSPTCFRLCPFLPGDTLAPGRTLRRVIASFPPSARLHRKAVHAFSKSFGTNFPSYLALSLAFSCVHQPTSDLPSCSYVHVHNDA